MVTRDRRGRETTPRGVRLRRLHGDAPFERWGRGDEPVYIVESTILSSWGDRLGYVERRRHVPVFDGAKRGNAGGWHHETQWVAFQADGRATDEAHDTRAGAVEELLRLVQAAG